MKIERLKVIAKYILVALSGALATYLLGVWLVGYFFWPLGFEATVYGRNVATRFLMLAGAFVSLLFYSLSRI